jgi:hypothetical protein
MNSEGRVLFVDRTAVTIAERIGISGGTEGRVLFVDRTALTRGRVMLSYRGG